MCVIRRREAMNSAFRCLLERFCGRRIARRHRVQLAVPASAALLACLTVLNLPGIRAGVSAPHAIAASGIPAGTISAHMNG